MNKDLFIFNLIIALAAIFGLGYLIWQVDIDVFGLMPDAVQERGKPAVSAPQPPPIGSVPFGDTVSTESGSVLFARHCAVCHGLDGHARSFIAEQPGMPGIADLSSLKDRDDESLLLSLREGKGGAMPAFGQRLSPAQINAVFAHCRSLIRGENSAESPQEPPTAETADETAAETAAETADERAAALPAAL